MDTRTITLSTADGPMDLYEVTPDAPNGAAVVVIQEAFGVNDHIEDVTRRFAAEGYHAVAPHIFHRAGGGTAPYDDFSKVLPLFEGLSDDALLVDVDAALAHLHDAGFADAQIGVVGFCMGGRVTFLVAVERALGAAVGFYGGGIVTGRFPQFPVLVERAGELKTPWLGLFGDLDASIPTEDVESLKKALTDAPVENDVVRYADAEHGFHCDKRPSYNADAAKDAWGRTLSWFGSRLS
ncbi:MAG: carboxymethylenebutenolidase [Actinomycetota bacterium]|nr:carboxymethylenebutenolidase [Actinomycetota bacterium]